MLSATVNQVKVDAGPLITRFKDADTGKLAYAGVFSPVRWWRLWATLWVSNLLFAVVLGAPGLLLLRLGWRALPKEVPWQDLVSVSGLGARQARREGWSNEDINKVVNKATSGDYNNLLSTLSAHCDVISEND